jgi:hypothetical protein
MGRITHVKVSALAVKKQPLKKEKEKEFKKSVYVWFTDELNQLENMWVYIESGNQKEGS